MSLNKKGGIELSMTTIVIIVISIIILIFGIIFAKNIMCSGIRVTDQIDQAVKNQLRDLFGADKLGVSCQGEEGSDVKLATGKRVSLVCQIKVDQPTNYRIDITDKLIGQVPQKLDIDCDAEIRGEVVIKKSIFEAKYSEFKI